MAARGQDVAAEVAARFCLKRRDVAPERGLKRGCRAEARQRAIASAMPPNGAVWRCDGPTDPGPALEPAGEIDIVARRGASGFTR
jgi:hypothetical protein